jgi:hypothetical protein
MHGFLKAIGGIVAVIGIVAGAGIAISAQNNTSAQLTGIMIGAGLALPGAMLYCFGAIVEHLIAIRKNTERQLAIFERLGQPKV